MSNALAVEGRFVVVRYLEAFASSYSLTYKFSVQENPREPQHVRVTFSKPTPATPSPAAVAHVVFHLDDRLQQVLGFSVESEAHFHSLEDMSFEETILDHVIRRKTHCQAQHLVDLSDEFSSTRVPAIIAARAEEQRERDRESLEEQLLERMQEKDRCCDNRISLADCKAVLHGIEYPGLRDDGRLVLLAFAELDRDGMVDYGAFVRVAADALDTLAHSSGHDGNVDQAAERKDPTTRVAESDILDWFQACGKIQQSHVLERLDQLCAALQPTEPATVPDSTTLISDEDDAGDDTDDESEEFRQGLRAEHLVTRRQLRECLETPALLLSKAEVNLILALIVANPSGKLSCSQLRDIYPRVQEMLFSYQRICFADRLERYLLHQLEEFERSKLQGSAEHLKMRICQRDLKVVIRRMKKLALSPFQLMRVIARCEAACGDLDSVVRYQDVVPIINETLRESVDVTRIAQHAMAFQDMESLSPRLPTEDAVTMCASKIFGQLDTTRSGVLTLEDFHSALSSIRETLNIGLDEDAHIHQLCVVADPQGQGRVNHVHFLQLLHPLLRFIVQDDAIEKRSESSHEKC